ncbi:hypothetical protein BU15DRAFT_61411 [Melanogaster broomeanus]|nr:hypothetical protein BU15DRAFT_61411 [Melanogaster broomeanus]
MHIHLRATRPSDADIYSRDNVRRAWLSVKRRFPLLAAEVQEEDGGSYFVLREENVVSLREGDVTFGTVSSFHDVERFINVYHGWSTSTFLEIVNSRILCFRRTDRPDHFHVVIVVAHCITDGSSTSTILRTFFQTLASPYDPSPLSIEARLQMYNPLESRIRLEDVSPAKRRWRKALGHAVQTVLRSRFKRRKLTPAKARRQIIGFSRELSALILSNCQRHNVTLNSAYYVLSQVALSRLLCRRYLRGEISEEEWEYRKREPMFFAGPLNLRPYQDQDWFEKGGLGEVGLNVSAFRYILPFMPLGAMSGKDAGNLELLDGAPLFEDLMSFNRFLLRCEVLSSQAQKLFGHPRFVDICVAEHNVRQDMAKAAALTWRGTGELRRAKSQCAAVYSRTFTWSDTDTGGLELGKQYWDVHIHARPAELYLGAATYQRQLQFFTFYDENVFGAETVREWLGEIRDAMLWYLGQPQDDTRGPTTKTKSKL